MFSYLMHGNSFRFFKIITCLFPLDGDVKELEKYIFVCLFGLRLGVPVNNFQSCRDGATASWILPALLGR